MPQPLAAGSVLGGRYRISDHVVTSADQDMVFHGADQVLNRRVTILVASQSSSTQVAASARELATGERQEDIQVLDLGLSEGRTYLVAGGSPDADVLLGLAYEQELHVEPFQTDTLGSEIFGASRAEEAHRYDDDETYYTDLDRRLRADDAQTRRRPSLVNRISEKLNERVRPADGTAAKTAAAAAALAAAEAAERAHEEERMRAERQAAADAARAEQEAAERKAAEREAREAAEQAEREAAEQAERVRVELAEREAREAQESALRDAEKRERRKEEDRQKAAGTEAARRPDGQPPLRPLTEAPPAAAPEAVLPRPLRPAPRRALNGPAVAHEGRPNLAARPITWSPGEHRAAPAAAAGAAATPRPTPATIGSTATPETGGSSAARAAAAPAGGRRGKTWLLALLLTLLLIGAIVLGFLLLGQNGRSVKPAPAAPAPAAPAPAAPAPAAVAPRPASVTRLTPDMPTLEEENDAALPNLIDGDAGTAWQTLSYTRPNFGGYVSHVDLVVALEQRAPVQEVTMDLQGSQGGSWTAFLADSADGENARQIGEGGFDEDRISIPVNLQDRDASFVTLRVTALPKLDGAGESLPHGLRLKEIAVR